MHGPMDPMTSLETRKRLLIAESDLLRGQLSEDVQALCASWGQSGTRLRLWSGLAASLAVLMTGLSALRSKPPDESRHRSWIGGILKGLSLRSTVWSGWKRSRGGSP